jgi:aconitate hydratase
VGQNLFKKIILMHRVAGELVAGKEVAIRVDQTLTQDSLGAMAYLQFEAMKKAKVETELSLSYVDHLMLQLGEGNGDVHKYLETAADHHGIVFSKPGNGICHQVHLERFSKPGKTLIGSDSHTVTCGAVGMAAFGVGGLDVALAMGGVPFYFTYPRVIRVLLIGELSPWSTAKDIVLELLKRITTKGNVGTIIEYGGSALKYLNVPQRATITNMGAEAGITTSIFPSDAMTRSFFKAQNREHDWIPLTSDHDAKYDQEIVINLAEIEPNVAVPHSPDLVKMVKEVENLKVNQVLIGSCTNSSYQDMMRTALILKGKKIHPDVQLGIAAGSRQVLSMLSEAGALGWMIDAGARILESGCGFCVGQGQAPEMGAVSIRTNNRNYKGRSGTQDAQVYLVSPETAAATALTGVLTDLRTLGMEYPNVLMPEQFKIDDSMFLFPSGTKIIYRSPLIGQPPTNTPMPQTFEGEVAIKVGDMINTDDIIPGGSAMTYRANIQKSCEFVFQFIDDQFPANCASICQRGRSPIIVGGAGYGQGSSREHAALCPMVMGVRCLLAKSIERIHQANLINFGILPLLFENETDYDSIKKGDILRIENIHKAALKDTVLVNNKTQKKIYKTKNGATERQRLIILKGGLLNSIKG